MKSKYLFGLIFPLIFFSCINYNSVDLTDPSLTLNVGDSLINKTNQLYTHGSTSYLDYQNIPDHVLLGFNVDFDRFNIEIRDMFRIDDLENSTASINRHSIEGGFSTNYHPSKKEFEKIFSFGSKNIVPFGDARSSGSGVILSLQIAGYTYLSNGGPFINNGEWVDPYFIIDEFKEISNSDIKNNEEKVDDVNQTLYSVKARFSLLLIRPAYGDSLNMVNPDTIVIHDAKANFVVHNYK